MQQKRTPEYLIVSASRAAHLPGEKEKISELEEPCFLKKLEELNGTPKEILNNEDLMGMLIPLLRADFKISETYQSPEVAMDFPIRVLYGSKDNDITMQQIQSWKNLTVADCEIVEINGDHFFINALSHKVIQQVLIVINSVLIGVRRI